MPHCRSCNRKIVWLVTEKGKNMPVDAETVDKKALFKPVFDPEIHTSHFATCPYAEQHRKPRADVGDGDNH